METTGESVSVLFRKFHTCETYVRQGKIAACIILFLEVLEKIPAAPLLKKEMKLLTEGIYNLQRNMAAHKNFKDLFGPVTFDDTDFNTTYEFLKQLKLAQEQEIQERLSKEMAQDEAERIDVDTLPVPDEEAVRERALLAIQHIEAGDIPKATETIDGMDEVISFILQHYNALGIQAREAAHYEDAIANYMKALAIYSQDEGLYYNMARAHHDLGNLDKARDYLNKALEINPRFPEGQKFNNHLFVQSQPGDEKKTGGFSTFLKRILFLKKRKVVDESQDTPEQEQPAPKEI